MNKIFGNFFLTVASFLLGIIIFEVTLQSYGLYLYWKRSQLDGDFNGKIRILTIGESTTDSLLAPDLKPWPVFLENYLNEKHHPLKFQVINKAKSGTSSLILLHDLPENLKKYKPHLVIAMMGINDSNKLTYLHDDSLWSKLKLVRFYRNWEEGRKKHENHQGMWEESRKKYENHQGMWEIITKMRPNQPFPREYYDFIEKNPDREILIKKYLAAHFLNISKAMNGKQLEETEKAAFQLAMDVVLMDPQDQHNARILTQASVNYPDLLAKARTVMKDIIRKGLVINRDNYALLDSIHYQDDPELVDLIKNIKFKELPLRRIDVTKNNFRRLEILTRESGSSLAIIAYPTTDINLFKNYYTDYVFKGKTFLEVFMLSLPPPKVPEEFEHIIFIENKNFPKTFDRMYYLDFFAHDRITRTGFGHPTMKGHELIARNAEEVLSKEWVPTLQPGK